MFRRAIVTQAERLGASKAYSGASFRWAKQLPVDELPVFLQDEVLKPFITEDLRLSTKPILYQVQVTTVYADAQGFTSNRSIEKSTQAFTRVLDPALQERGIASVPIGSQEIPPTKQRQADSSVRCVSLEVAL